MLLSVGNIIQIKITKRYYYIPTKMAKIQNTEQSEIASTAGRRVNGSPALEKV